MKTLVFNGQKFEAVRIIKSTDTIVGKDINGNELFVFRGISDFSGFTLDEGQLFDIEEPIEQEVLNSQLLKENADMKAQLSEQQELTANLLLQVASLKGGSTSV